MTSRLDPPQGFFESLGLPDNPIARATRGPAPPMAEVRLPKNPKLPNDQEASSSDAWTTLESVEKGFHELLSKTFCLRRADVTRTIHLRGPIIRQQHDQTKVGTIVSVAPWTLTVQWISEAAEAGESTGV